MSTRSSPDTPPSPPPPAHDEPRPTDCTLRFEGQEVPAVAGEPVAVALFAAGTHVLSRSIKYHRPRSFFCLAGHCGACLTRIDGVPNVKACRTPARDGLVIERQNAFPSGSFDVLGVADWFFARGMNHHTLMTSSRALNALMRRVVREIGGLGRLPDEETAPPSREGLPRGVRRHVDVAVVGGGPAGLAAATAAARATGGAKKVLLIDEGDRPGGSLLSHPAHGPAAAETLAAEALAAGVEIRCSTPAFGYYPEDEGGVLAADDGGTLLRLSADRFVYATGGYDVNALFYDNDRPGICAARAIGALLVRYGVKPGRKPLVLGRGEYATALADALAGAGCEVSLVDGETERAVAALGHAWVSGLEVERDGAGERARRRIECDTIAVAATPAPATELLRLHGARVSFDAGAGGFAAVVDDEGRTTQPNVYACGDACGYVGVAAARAQGERVGRAVAASLSTVPAR